MKHNSQNDKLFGSFVNQSRLSDFFSVVGGGEPANGTAAPTNTNAPTTDVPTPTPATPVAEPIIRQEWSMDCPQILVAIQEMESFLASARLTPDQLAKYQASIQRGREAYANKCKNPLPDDSVPTGGGGGITGTLSGVAIPIGTIVPLGALPKGTISGGGGFGGKGGGGAAESKPKSTFQWWWLLVAASIGYVIKKSK